MPRSATLPTKPSTHRLSEVARHVVIPKGIVTTGWPAVSAKCAEFGDSFDEWQHGVGRIVLGKRADGLYAATVGGITLSIPRQVAKTFLVGRIVVAMSILFPGLTVLWTAHHNRTLTRTFRSMQAFVKRRKVSVYLAPNGIRTANGEQEIKFSNGSIIMFGAREQGFGRGFEEVDIEVFDEAQILTEKALEDMVAATNQSRHPHGALLFYMGTPPRPTDPGEAFTIRRTKALSGKSDDLVYIECSADEDADPDDRAQWSKANPSYPHRTPLPSMLRLRENLPSDDSWRREALGIWDKPFADGPINVAKWMGLQDPHSSAISVTAFGIDISMDRTVAAIAAAGPREDGHVHIELIDLRAGTGWLINRCLELDANWHPSAFVLDEGGPAASLVKDFEDSGLSVLLTTTADVASASARFVDAVDQGTQYHGPQRELDDAVRGAKRRTFRDGGFAFGRKPSGVDISPLVAVTLAAWGHDQLYAVGAASYVL